MPGSPNPRRKGKITLMETGGIFGLVALLTFVIGLVFMMYLNLLLWFPTRLGLILGMIIPIIPLSIGEWIFLLSNSWFVPLLFAVAFAGIVVVVMIARRT